MVDRSPSHLTRPLPDRPPSSLPPPRERAGTTATRDSQHSSWGYELNPGRSSNEFTGSSNPSSSPPSSARSIRRLSRDQAPSGQASSSAPPAYLVEVDDIAKIQEAVGCAEAIFKFCADYSKFPDETTAEREIRLLNLRVHSGDLIRMVQHYISLLRSARVLSDLEQRAQMTLMM